MNGSRYINLDDNIYRKWKEALKSALLNPQILSNQTKVNDNDIWIESAKDVSGKYRCPNDDASIFTAYGVEFMDKKLSKNKSSEYVTTLMEDNNYLIFLNNKITNNNIVISLSGKSDYFYIFDEELEKKFRFDKAFYDGNGLLRTIKKYITMYHIDNKTDEEIKNNVVENLEFKFVAENAKFDEFYKTNKIYYTILLNIMLKDDIKENFALFDSFSIKEGVY